MHLLSPHSYHRFFSYLSCRKSFTFCGSLESGSSDVRGSKVPSHTFRQACTGGKRPLEMRKGGPEPQTPGFCCSCGRVVVADRLNQGVAQTPGSHFRAGGDGYELLCNGGSLPPWHAHLIATGLQEKHLGLGEGCHGDGLDPVRGIQPPPTGRMDEEGRGQGQSPLLSLTKPQGWGWGWEERQLIC